MADLTDEELVRRAVRGATSATRRRPSWACVADVFCVGSTLATDLCRRFGVDPDEEVGPEDEVTEASETTPKG